MTKPTVRSVAAQVVTHMRRQCREYRAEAEESEKGGRDEAPKAPRQRIARSHLLMMAHSALSHPIWYAVNGLACFRFPV